MASQQLRTYRAHSMADALTEVKKDLGKDAVILHTRSYTVGGVMGFGGKQMVEVTASTASASLPVLERRRAAAASAVPTPPAAAARAYAQSAATPAANSSPRSLVAARTAPGPLFDDSSAQPRPADSDDAVRNVVRVALRSSPAAQPEPAAPTAPSSAKPSSFRPAKTATPTLEEELASIKRMVAHVLHSTRRAPGAAPDPVVAAGGSSHAGLSDALTQSYMKLLEGAVAQELADEIIHAVRHELRPAELADPDAVRQAVLRRLAQLVPVSSGAAKPPTRAADGRPTTIAVVGPTGVGKTTTLAKLAATYKLRHGKRVGLITADTYRIAAVEQLRTYANIIGLPLKVAASPTEMAAACESLADRDVILVDTAGRSPTDTGSITELAAMLAAARPHETHLVLSSTATEPALLLAAERFRAAQPTHMIFTKLDEAVNLGVLLNVGRRVELSLSYLTTGQEVPDHIEPGRSDRIARLVLDGESVR